MKRSTLFSSRYSELVDAVNSCISKDISGEGTLFEAMRYGVLGGGKRIRPVLVLAIGEMLGVPQISAQEVSVAVEFVHASSLIHDDLPVLDNDTLRRGQPTCHIRYGPGIALLAGDALLSEAFSALGRIRQVSPALVLRLVGELSAAITNLCHGQVLDVQATSDNCQSDNEKRQLNQDIIAVLEDRHLRKTGALFGYCCAAPAIIGGRTIGEIEKLRQFGMRLGLLFQITDDILDVVSPIETLGKNPGGDARHGTATYVSVLGLDGARRTAAELYDECVGRLAVYGDNAWFLLELCAEIASRIR